MISKEEYYKIRMLLSRTNVTRPKNYEFAYTGIIKCKECGAMVTAENKHKVQKNGNKHHYIYYHCTKRKDPNCTQRKNVEEKKLESQIEDHLARLYLPSDFIQWSINQISIVDEKQIKDNELVIANLSREQTKVGNATERLLDLRLADEIDKETYLRKKSEYDETFRNLEAQIIATKENGNKSLSETTKLFNFASTALDKFRSGDLWKKKEIVSAIGSNLLMENGKLRIQFEKPLSYVESISSTIQALETDSVPFEPSKCI